MAKEQATIVIRREEVVEGGHHGGAWKVAYADFVTAMMAFFLLMWLLNATTEEQRKGLADYFAPTNLFGHASSGNGKPFGGKTPNDTGTMVSTTGALQVMPGRHPAVEADEDATDNPTPAPSGEDSNPETHAPVTTVQDRNQPVSEAPKTGPQALAHGGDYAAPALQPAPPGTTTTDLANPTAAAQAASDADADREQRALSQLATKLRDSIRQDPGLQDVASQLSIENVPEGLRIQMLDAERKPMFSLGDAAPTVRVRELIQKIEPLLAGLPNEISIAGHTDGAIYHGQGKSNWELSSDRANTTRRLLVEDGLPETRIRSVTGNADRDLLIPTDPLNPANRRVAIVVLRHNAAAPH